MSILFLTSEPDAVLTFDATLLLPDDSADVRSIARWVDANRDHWAGCTSVVVEGRRSPQIAQDALALFSLIRIVPAAFVGRPQDLLHPFLQPRPGWFAIVSDLSEAAGALARLPVTTLDGVQENWARTVFTELEAELSHSNLSHISLLRMARGARQIGLLTIDEYRQVVAAVDEPLLAAFLPAPTNKDDPERHKRPLKASVLLIDDQPEWEPLLKSILESAGLGLAAERTLQSGCERLKRNGRHVAAVLLDLHLGNEDKSTPTEVVNAVATSAPQVPLILFTHRRDGESVRRLAPRLFFHFFKEYEPAGTADVAGQVKKFIKVVKSAVDARGTYGAEQLSAWACGAARINPAFSDLLGLQARHLHKPMVAVSLNTGLWTAGAEYLGSKSAFGTRACRLFRNYAAHAHEEALKATFLEALGSWILWLDQIAAAKRIVRTELDERLSDVLVGFAHSAVGFALLRDVTETAGDDIIDVEKCSSFCESTRKSLTTDARFLRWRRARIDTPPAEHRACDDLFFLGYQTKTSTLTSYLILAQALLLCRLREVSS